MTPTATAAHLPQIISSSHVGSYAAVDEIFVRELRGSSDSYDDGYYVESWDGREAWPLGGTRYPLTAAGRSDAIDAALVAIDQSGRANPSLD